MQTSQTATAGAADHPPRFAVPHDENSFVDWLVDAKPGERTVYYRGHLAHDRMTSAGIHDRQNRSCLGAVASRVMTAAEQGLVHPVQKKVGPEDFLYFAVRASSRRAGSAAARIPLSSFARPVVAAMPEAVAA
ncbi:MAG: hypothetical protein INR68_05560 [Methylobacterium mesophilicum]|nr:hypothetical protein [Methylobacterium mesophilicum]